MRRRCAIVGAMKSLGSDRGMHAMFIVRGQALRGHRTNCRSRVRRGRRLVDFRRAGSRSRCASNGGKIRRPARWTSFYCDDIEATVRELKARGVEFTRPVEDQGLASTRFKVPAASTYSCISPSTRSSAQLAARLGAARKRAEHAIREEPRNPVRGESMPPASGCRIGLYVARASRRSRHSSGVNLYTRWRRSSDRRRLRL